jgi:CDGSH-type Zn-finger protein
MPDVTIRLRANGPLVVEGPFKLIDSRGAEFAIPTGKPAVALCRCGQSAKRPFCDGTHRDCGFVSDEAPTPPAVG